MGKKTPLYQSHINANAKMVDFFSWEMPLHYGSQVEEHHQVRKSAGVFDVSHMTIVDFQGPDTFAYLQKLLANNVDRLVPGKALYTCMLNTEGFVIDDLIVYKIADDFYRLIVNSATHDKDLAWFNQHLKNFNIQMTERHDLAMLAIQGPEVLAKLSQIFPYAEDLKKLKPFQALSCDDLFIARTGYTGEDGFEIIVPEKRAQALWEKILASGIKPCGLGARDTLRLEAGLNLYGADMDETVTPLESNLAWTVAFEPQDRDFIGRSALQKQKEEGLKKRLVGLILKGPGVLRNHQKVMMDGEVIGEITSGSFSPTLQKGIAFARVAFDVGSTCYVDIRGKSLEVDVVKLPFVRFGKKNILETV
jgi:aminomethyltransferase